MLGWNELSLLNFLVQYALHKHVYVHVVLLSDGVSEARSSQLFEQSDPIVFANWRNNLNL